MRAHELITSLKNGDLIVDYESLPTPRIFQRKTIESIAAAVKFDAGDPLNIPQTSGRPSFDVHAPYPLTYVETTNIDSYQSMEGLLPAGFVVAALCRDEIETLEMTFFVKNPEKKKWIFPNVTYVTPHNNNNENDWEKRGDYFLPKIDEEIKNAFSEIAVVFLYFFAALMCSNVHTVDNPPPKALNKSRRKKGKVPLFSYKTLHLTLPTSHTKTEQTESSSGRAAPRVHLRRGHIRILNRNTEKQQMVWVQPCVVGDKSRGVLLKDYKVK